MATFIGLVPEPRAAALASASGLRLCLSASPKQATRACVFRHGVGASSKLTPRTQLKKLMTRNYIK